MKLFILFLLINSLFVPVFSGGYKKYKIKDFEKIKIMKIEYLNKKMLCVKNSQNFKQLKNCWKKEAAKN